MKQIIIILSLLFLAACSTTPKVAKETARNPLCQNMNESLERLAQLTENASIPKYMLEEIAFWNSVLENAVNQPKIPEERRELVLNCSDEYVAIKKNKDYLFFLISNQ